MTRTAALVAIAVAAPAHAEPAPDEPAPDKPAEPAHAAPDEPAPGEPAHAAPAPGEPAPGEPGSAARAGGRRADADEPTVDGEVIVVTGTRSETPRSESPVTTEVIERQRLVESGVQTVGEALAMRPGLWLERGVGGGLGLTIQGLGPEYSAVLVDGARQIGRTGGALDLERFGIDDLEQIEIVRGPSSVLYGSDALGGVVNLVTRAAREGIAVDALARIDGRLGYEGRARVAGGHRGIAGALSASHREAPAFRRDPSSAATTISAFDDTHVAARGTHRRTAAWRFDAAAEYLIRDLRGVDAIAGGAVLDRRNLIETATAQLAARWTGERTTVRLDGDAGLYRDQFLSDQRLADGLDRYEVTDEHLIELRAQAAHQRERHHLLAGGEVLREALDSDRLSSPGDRTRAALYLQHEWLGGDVVIAPGARLDVDTQFGAHATPRVAARWQAAERAAVRASLGMGYRAPSFKELLLHFQNPGAGYVVEGNPMLGPETSVSVQAGAQWQAARWLWVSADAYANRISDMIFVVAQPDDGSGTLRFGYANIGRARTAGTELYAIATRGRAGLELGWAFTHTRDLDEDRALEGVPAQRVSATARWRDKADGFDAFAALVVTGRRPFYLDDGAPTVTGRRVELRARIAKRLRGGLGGFLGADNLLDAGDAELDRLPPRTLYAGLEVHR